MREINLATIDEHAMELAEKYDLGIELDQFCTAMYMDPPEFETWDADARRFLPRARVFHGPFNEICPCAIDPKVKALSMERYNQAFQLMYQYGLKKLILHGGFVPNVYFPVWYIEQSIAFWKDFLADKPEDFTLCLENVMEPEPSYLVDIVAGVDDKRCRLCLDTGHANVGNVSTVPIPEWVKAFAPYLAHAHLHNNDGVWDWHKNLAEGTIPMEEVLDLLDELAPSASFTFENIDDSEESILWYQKKYQNAGTV